jgi:pimeloyl-ACP methyl ester carboxylesterase
MLLPALLAGLLAACGGTTRAVHSTTSVAGVDPPAKRCGPPARPAGFRVLLFDLRCYGLSGCPSGREDDVVDDVAAAVEELRGRGATSIELVGASYGGSVALVATARLADVSALADLSGDELTEPIGGQGRPTTAVQAAAEARAPALLAVARNDGYIALEDERALYRRLGSSRKRLVVLPAEAGHGWDLLARVGAPDEWSQFERTLTAFLVAHSS